jgi:O-antigen/teichoic acid export membrane protein
MSSIKNVIQNSFLYGLSSILLRASSIIFFPIFSLYLTKNDYGILSITQTLAVFLTIVTGMELNSAVTRFIYKENQSEEFLRSLYGTSFLAVFIFNVAIVGVLVITGPFFLKPVLNQIPFFPYMTIVLVAMPFIAVFELLKSYLVATHQGSKTFVLVMLYFGSNIFLNLVFVVFFKTGVLGLLLSTFIVAVCFSVYSFFAFFSKADLKFNKRIFKIILSYSLPLIPFALLGNLMEGLDKFVLNAKYGFGVSGIYYIALVFASIFSVLKESINSAFTPWFFEHMKDVSQEYVNYIVNILFAGACILALAVGWFSHEVLLVLSSNPELITAWKYIPGTVLALVIVFLGQISNLITFYYQKNVKYLFFSNMGGAIIGFVFCLFLFNYWGILAAVGVRIVAFTTMTLIQILVSYKSSTFRFNYKFLFMTLGGTSALLMVPFLPLNVISLFVLKLLLFFTIGTIYVFQLNKKISVSDFIKERYVLLNQKFRVKNKV